MKPARIVLLLLAILLVLPGTALANGPRPGLPAAGKTPPPPEAAPHGWMNAEETEAMGALVRQQFQNQQLDHAYRSADGTQAVLWLADLDPETGEVIPSEPVLAIALQVERPLGWRFVRQGDAGWDEALAALTPELLNETALGDLLEQPKALDPSAAAGQVFGGYLLPWPGGLTKKISYGATHPSCPGVCRYATDFYDGTMFPLLAAKGGTIFHWDDHCANGDESCTNSLVIKDTSTIPTTYQIYLHLRHNSIPDGLKQPGTPVVQGAYIGDVDDTGYSSGHHLHFMVVAEGSLYKSTKGYYWGQSVDITYRDVSINWDSATQGGRPCNRGDVSAGLCGEWRAEYTSQNRITYPPTADLSAPDDLQVITTPDVWFSGWAADDTALQRAALLANADGAWRELDVNLSLPNFSQSVNLCQAGLSDGPVTLALRVWDVEGNQTDLIGLRRLVVNAGCPPVTQPSCAVTADQVALFTEPGLSGTCKVFNVGTYANGAALGGIGDNQAASILVGKEVSATIYSEAGPAGRAETFTADKDQDYAIDRSLADNRVGLNTVSALRVERRAKVPYAPRLMPLPSKVTTDDSLVFAWDNQGGSTKFEAALLTGAYNASWSNQMFYRAYSPETTWSVGTLPANQYTLVVRARITDYNDQGTAVPYYSADNYVTFYVGRGAAAPASVGFPYAADFNANNGGWTATGLWKWAPAEMDQPAGNKAWVFQNDSGGYSGLTRGDLTSPPIAVPAGSPAFLRFNQRVQTESAEPYYDQRRVQISANGGGFTDVDPTGGTTNVAPLTQEPAGYWLNSVVYDLSAYAGKTVRVRFHFNSIDDRVNQSGGWWINSVTLGRDGPVACAQPDTTDQTGATTPAIAVGQALAGAVCPGGDVDLVRFSARAGEQIKADLIATGARVLDPQLILLDGQGHFLALHDDLDPESNRDARLLYSIPADGDYYLKVRAWDHPEAGSAQHTYQLSLTTPAAGDRPVATLSAPVTGQMLPAVPFNMAVTVQGGDENVRKVEFLYHDPNWRDSGWKLLGSDQSSAEGWSLTVNPASLPSGNDYAFAARVWDWSGNQVTSVAWRVRIDREQPVTVLQPLPPAAGSTRVVVTWKAVENNSGLKEIDLQIFDQAANRQSEVNLPAAQTSYAFVGEPGHTYAFRVRGIDTAGNAEPYPTGWEATTTLPTGCTPDVYDAQDGQQAGATGVQLNQASLLHKLCGAGDQDWIQVDAKAGQVLSLTAAPEPGSPAWLRATWFQANGQPLSGPYQAAGPGAALVTSIAAPTNGAYYVLLQDVDDRVTGDQTGYTSWLGDGGRLLLPLISGGS